MSDSQAESAWPESLIKPRLHKGMGFNICARRPGARLGGKNLVLKTASCGGGIKTF